MPHTHTTNVYVCKRKADNALLLAARERELVRLTEVYHLPILLLTAQLCIV